MSVSKYSVVLNGQGTKSLPDGTRLSEDQLNYGLFDYFHMKQDDHLNADIILSGLVNLRAIVMGPDVSRDASIDVTLSDETSGTTASQVDFMFFFGVDTADITLDRAKVRYVTGDGENFNLTYGSETISSVDLYATNNTITGANLPGAHVDKMFLRGKNDVTLKEGYFGTLDLGGAGQDRAVIGEGATLVNLRASGKTIDVRVWGDGILESLKLNNSTGDIGIAENATVYTMQLDNGSYEIRSKGGDISVISGFNSTLSVDGHGLEALSMAGGLSARTHDLAFRDWVGSINISNSGATGAGDQTTNLTLNGGAGTVRLGYGDDVVNVGNGYVELVSTGRGADTVILGSQSASMVRTGAHNDTIRLGNMGANEGVVIDGGNGNDTLDARNYRGEIIWDVDAKEVRSVDSSFGYFRAENIEFVIGGRFASDSNHNINNNNNGSRTEQVGTSRADTLNGLNSNDLLNGRGGSDALFGNGGQDRLQGGNGSDQLSGGDGRDQLVGGRGNDDLRGGQGEDTFIFGRFTGEDVIRDFEIGQDHIKLNQQSNFANLRFFSTLDGQLVVHDQGVIEVRGLGNQTLDAGDFIL